MEKCAACGEVIEDGDVRIIGYLMLVASSLLTKSPRAPDAPPMVVGNYAFDTRQAVTVSYHEKKDCRKHLFTDRDVIRTKFKEKWFAVPKENQLMEELKNICESTFMMVQTNLPSPPMDDFDSGGNDTPNSSTSCCSIKSETGGGTHTRKKVVN